MAQAEFHPRPEASATQKTGATSNRNPLGFLLQVELYLWAANRILETSDLKAILLFTTSGETVEVDYSQELRDRCDRMVDNLPITVVEEAFPVTTWPALCQECGFKARGLCPGALG